MSGKVSTAASVSSGPSIPGGKSAPTAPATAAAGSAGSEGAGASPGSRGSGAGSSAHFSSAMAEAAHSGDQAALENVRDGGSQTDADGAGDAAQGSNTGSGEASRSSTAADMTGDASRAVNAGSPDISTNATPLLNQVAANPKTGATATGKACGGRVAASTGGDAGTNGTATASTAPTDPMVLAMLLAGSGMQLNADAGASSPTHGTSGAPANAGDGSEAATAPAGSAADGAPAAGSVPAADLLPAANTAAAAASAQQGRAAPATLDAASSSAAAGSGLPDQSAPLQSKNVNPEPQTAQPSIVTDATGLPELVRSFASGTTQAPAVEAAIPVPLGSGGWPQAVAAQVHWFVSNDVQSATLRLSPEHLGPVEVHIDVRESQVNVNFSAAHAETRAALEQTVPRLREIFASSGLSLGQANVQQDPRAGSKTGANPLRAALAHAQNVEPVAVAAGQALGLVDEYA